MVTCEICKLEFKNFIALSHHIKIHNIELKEYYDKYLNTGKKSCLNCGCETRFKSLTVGYIKFCSTDCAYKYRIGKPKNIVKKIVEENIECNICGVKLVSLKALSQHLVSNHPEVTSQIYYDTYLKTKPDEGKCLECGCDTKFNGLVKGYQKYCSSKCANNNRDKIEKFKESYLKNDVETVKNKRKQTNLERYGNEVANRNEDIKEKNKLSFLQGQLYKKLKYIQNFELEFVETNYEIKTNRDLQKFKCKKCGKIFEETLANILQRIYKCECQVQYSTSINENKLKDFIKENLKEEILFNKKIDGYEFDILIPSKNIAIEYNGLYWHSENILKDPVNYHNNKLNICTKNKYRLIQIFEDEWLNKQDIIKNRILHFLNCKVVEKIHGRKCSIEEISVQQKDEFLEKFHIQGRDISSIRLGAFYQEKLVSVMTFSKGNISKGSHSEEGVWELNRFCSDYNYHIPGVAGKLLSHFKRNYEWKQIFSYADRRWSDGNLYEKIGFKLDYITNPNYWYTKTGMERTHRFNLRKKQDEPKDIPEWVLRQTEGYYRIWDCGNYRFIMSNF